jgi:hypothetical protein
MRALTEDAVLVCLHELGRVTNIPTQMLVRIDGRLVLVEKDPEMKSIGGCPNIGMTIKPCQLTLPVQIGYSALVKIDGRRVCLSSVRGLTDGTPPGTVEYKVRLSGQKLVDSAS